ncbi:hypothetical protein HaLaN_23855, partial [Haematococcus lacustris]
MLLQVVAVLSSFSALPVERLHNIIKFTSPNQKDVMSLVELGYLCEAMALRGTLTMDARGWMSVKRPGSPTATP